MKVILKEVSIFPENTLEDDDFFTDPTESEKIRALLRNLADIFPDKFKSDEVPDMPAHTKHFAKINDKSINIKT